MVHFLLIAASIIVGVSAALLATRSTVVFSFQNTRIKVSLAVLGCGIKYNSDGNRMGVFCRRWIHYFKIGEGKLKKRDRKRAHAKTEESSPRKARRLSLSTIIKIVKAGIIFVAGFLSRVQYDEGKIEVQPIIANPALAGMAYGWGQALYGVFPGMGRVINVAPAYGTGKSRISGYMVLSIKNRQIAALVWRLLLDLPIIELIKYRFSKKR